jgi:hypothetical protein
MGDSVRRALALLCDQDGPTMRAAMALEPEALERSPLAGLALPPTVRVLVQLGALMADDGPATSVAWLGQRASCAGISADRLVQVLGIVATEAGEPCIPTMAPRLALALGYEPPEPVRS